VSEVAEVFEKQPAAAALAPQDQRDRWTNIVFCTRELFGGANYALINPVLLKRLAEYRDYGCPVGSFLQAVISNDLRRAISCADEYNRSTLYHLVSWMYNEFPSPLWGSEEKYSTWINTKREERERAEVSSTESAQESQS
jgi:hypothetical protein